MTKNCLPLTLSLFFCLSTFRLNAQSSHPPLNSPAPEFTLKGGSGLQAVHSFVGWRSLSLSLLNRRLTGTWLGNTTSEKLFGGTYNTATGTDALYSATGGGSNTADGYYALHSTTVSYSNVAVGYEALADDITGSYNTAVGALASPATSSSQNTAVGFSAMNSNETGSTNTAIGYLVMDGNVNGSNSTAVGANAMSEGNESNSVAVGEYALRYSSSSAGYNTAIGANAMGAVGSYANTGGYNTVIGSYGLEANSTGYYNFSGGSYAMYVNTTGSYNSATGAGALYSNTSGGENVGIGELALYSNTTGSSNTALGYFANAGSGALSNAMALGANSVVSSSNSVVIGSSSVTSIGGYAGWTNFSDGRYKKNIQQNVPGLAFIKKLTPITYTLDINGIEAKLHENTKSPDKNLAASDPAVQQSMQEKSSVTYTGFVAQDVEKAADSIGFVFSGIDKPKDVNQSFYGLRYGDFVVPLVKAVQELSASSDKKDSTISTMQGQLDSLQTQINELRSLILARNSSVMSGASLDQNAPNPSSNMTTIGYNLPQGVSSAKMQITDISGNILRIVPLYGVGRNTVTIDTSGFASGTYTYSLLINGQLAGTRKMIAAR
jgi:hypothetical protein